MSFALNMSGFWAVKADDPDQVGYDPAPFFDAAGPRVGCARRVGDHGGDEVVDEALHARDDVHRRV